ncbi:PstS family phosphate ABC transporter substrate-binding protein [Paenibacillus marinisediminis]
MKKWGKRIMMLALVTALMVVMTACGDKKQDAAAGNTPGAESSTGSSNAGTTAPEKLSGTIDIDGSSTVYPITEAMAEEFSKENKDVRVSVGTSGTGGGFKRFVKGETAMSNASRPIKEEELAAAKENGIDVLELEVAYDGLSVVVNKDNTFVDKLTLDELKKIYGPGSTVKTWADVREGWPAEEIKIYSPGADHGTFEYFTEVINGKAKEMRNDTQISFASDTNAIVQGVAGDKSSIGYFGFNFYEENKDKLKLVPIDNGKATVSPSFDTIKDNSYAPLSRPLYVYVNKAYLDKPEVKAFVEYYLTNVGSVLQDVGYVALPQEKYDEQLKSIQ